MLYNRMARRFRLAARLDNLPDSGTVDVVYQLILFKVWYLFKLSNNVLESLSTFADYLGINNPASLCYLTSVLHVLSMTPRFPDAVKRFGLYDVVEFQ